MAETQVIGKSLPRIDGVAKVTGRATYAGDLILAGMLHAKVLRSPHAHARIVRIDTEQAAAFPGVRAVVTARDLPEVPPGKVQPLAGEFTNYQGEAVAAVAADTLEIAYDALALLEVEYEPLPAVLDVMDAVASGAPAVHAWREPGKDSDERPLPPNVQSYSRKKRGDVDAVLAGAELVQEDTYRTQAMHQGYLEPRATVASVDANGRINVWTSTQSQFHIRSGLASQLNVPLSDINVRAMTLGGGFGGKGFPTIEAIPIALARKARRPVRLILTRHEEFLCGKPRGEMVIKIKTGLKKDGTLLARAVEIYGNGGAYGTGFGDMAAPLALGPYRLEAWRTDFYGVNTHTLLVGAHRAPGGPQAAFACESQMDAIAERLGMDPVELRLKNLVREGDFVFGSETMPPSGWEETVRKSAEAAGWAERRKGSRTQTPANGSPRRRGAGVACALWRGYAGQSGATATVNEDGTYRILHGVIDMTGTDTVFAQIAAETLGVSPDRVTITLGDTDSTPVVDGTWGSRTTYGQGSAIKRACEDLNRQILEVTAAEWDTKAEDLEIVEGEVRSRADVSQRRTLKKAIQAAQAQRGNIIGTGSLSELPINPALNCQVVEVEVDVETGFVEVLSLIAAQDVGRALNPAMVEGQIEGGAVQGLGFALWEEYIYGPARDGGNGNGNGDARKLMNANFLDYRMPTPPDVGTIRSIIVEHPTAEGPFGAKGVGECPICPTAAAVANAIYDAVGVRVKELPITPERLLWAMREPKGS